MLTLIYSSSDSLESSQGNLQVISNISNHIFCSFSVYLRSFNNTCRQPFSSCFRTESINAANRKIRANIIRRTFRYIPIMKICSLIAVRSYLGFPKFLIAERFTIKFFFNTLTDSISNIIIFFLNKSKNSFIQFHHQGFVFGSIMRNGLIL